MNIVRESKAAFELKLSFQWCIYPVFHASLLDSYQRNSIKERKQTAAAPPKIINGELEYEVEDVLDFKI